MSENFWAFWMPRAPHYCRYPEDADGATACVECGGRAFVQRLDAAPVANGDTLTISYDITLTED